VALAAGLVDGIEEQAFPPDNSGEHDTIVVEWPLQ
jgi:hypothetical protein